MQTSKKRNITHTREYWQKKKQNRHESTRGNQEWDIYLSRARMLEWKYNNRKGNFSFYMPRSKKLAQRNIFYFVVLGFKTETFSLHLTRFTDEVDLKSSFAEILVVDYFYNL